MVGNVHAPGSEVSVQESVGLWCLPLRITGGQTRTSACPLQLALFHCLSIHLGVAEGQPLGWVYLPVTLLSLS